MQYDSHLKSEQTLIAAISICVDWNGEDVFLSKIVRCVDHRIQYNNSVIIII